MPQGVEYIDTTNRRVGINRAAFPTGTLDISTASASTKGLILRATTSQNVNILEYTDPTGAIYGYINSAGEINPAGSLIGKVGMLCIGNFAGRLVSSSGDPWGSDYSSFIGYNAGYNANNASFGIYIGESAGRNSIGYYSSFIGTQAGYSATPGAKGSCTLIGTQAGYTAGGTTYSMTNATMIGTTAGAGVNSNADGACFIGTAAGNASSGTNNLFIGYSAGRSYNGSFNNIVMTRATDYPVTTGSRNMMFGLFGGNGNDNVYMGYTYAAGYAPRGTGNIVIGGSANGSASAGHLMRGNHNILIGNAVSTYFDGGTAYVHGSGLLGSFNIDIAPTNAYSNISTSFGSELATNVTLSNKLNIARTIRGDISTKQVSIGNASLAPTATLDIISNSSSRKGVIIQGAAAQSANYFEIQNSAGTPLLAITASGSISGAISPTILTSSVGITLTDEHHGDIIEYTGTAGSGTFTLGTNTQITIPSWNCMVVNVASGVIIASGTNTMRSPGALNKSRTQYSSISIYRRGTNDFMLGGDLA